MKKVFLLCALVCVGQMYGMESERSLLEAEHISQLSRDLHQKIINTALTTSNTVDEAIKAINGASALYGLKYDTSTATDLLMKRLPDNIDEAINTVKHLQGTTLKDFTALVSILAKKFPDEPRSLIATKFNTPIADQYVSLGMRLIKILGGDYRDTMKRETMKAIQDGADVNFTTYVKNMNGNTKIMTPLFFTGSGTSNWVPSREIIQLLLNHGADQYFNVKDDGTLLEVLKKNLSNSAIIEILEKAREEK